MKYKIDPIPGIIKVNKKIFPLPLCTRIGQILCNFECSCIYMWLRHFA